MKNVFYIYSLLISPYYQKRNCKMKFMFSVSKLLSIATICAASFSISACAVLDTRSISELPKNFTMAVENAKGEDYPKLVNIPAKPREMFSDAQWNLQQKSLEKTGNIIASNPNSRDLTAEEKKTDWATAAIADFERNPKSQTPVVTEDAAAWAARMRAILDKNTAFKN